MSRKINFKKYLKDLMILESEKIRLNNIHSSWESFLDRIFREENRKKKMYYEEIRMLRNNEIKNIKVKRINMPIPPVTPKKETKIN